jgi:hypothetical protein
MFSHGNWITDPSHTGFGVVLVTLYRAHVQDQQVPVFTPLQEFNPSLIGVFTMFTYQNTLKAHCKQCKDIETVFCSKTAKRQTIAKRARTLYSILSGIRTSRLIGLQFCI